MTRTMQVAMIVLVPEDATTGPDYGHEAPTPEFLREYLQGAADSLLTRIGYEIDPASVVVTEI